MNKHDENSKGCYVKIKVANMEAILLIDTGAEVSVIDYKFCIDNPEVNYYRRNSSTKWLAGIGGNRVQVAMWRILWTTSFGQ